MKTKLLFQVIQHQADVIKVLQKGGVEGGDSDSGVVLCDSEFSDSVTVTPPQSDSGVVFCDGEFSETVTFTTPQSESGDVLNDNELCDTRASRLVPKAIEDTKEDEGKNQNGCLVKRVQLNHR